jgi:hypothetical protein
MPQQKAQLKLVIAKVRLQVQQIKLRFLLEMQL